MKLVADSQLSSRRWLLLIFCLGVFCGVGYAEDPPTPREFAELTTGVLYLPPHLTPHNGKVDVLIHFHGGTRIMPNTVDQLRINSAVVLVNYGGFSSVYRKPFEEPDRFANLLLEVMETLQADARFPDDVKLGRVVIVSFSAGYGAVREILKTPEYVDRIAGVLMTDSMYASYTGNPAQRHVEPAHVAPFVAYAKRAAADEKVLIVTHTYLQPTGYAGTHETAAHLLAELNLPADPVPQDEAMRDDTGPLRMVERTDMAGLHVYGYAGTTGQDHGAHLMNTAGWLPMLPVELLPAE